MQHIEYASVSVQRFDRSGQLDYVIFNGIFGLIRAPLVNED